MIITKVQGGLGNQLFQWAVSRSLSLKHNTEYFLDLNYIGRSYERVTSRGFDLDKFNNLKISTSPKISNLNTVFDNFIYKDIDDNSYLDGYWQSEKYFKQHENIIRNDLKIPANIKESLKKKYLFLNEETLSIHVRRGDYLNLPKHYAKQDIKYYENAYDIINNNNVIVVVFSDDIEWCKNNLKFKNIKYIENQSNRLDLYMMSLCTNNIMANSTFSWWGSWLNTNVNKTVISPIHWFGPALNLSEDDLIPTDWIRI